MSRELSDTGIVFETVVLSTKSTFMGTTMTLSTMLADAGAAAGRKFVDARDITCPAT